VNSAVLATSMIATMVALYGALLCYMPQLTRRDLYFSVTVPPSFRDTPDARRTLHRYRLRIVLVSTVLVATTIVLGRVRPGTLMTLTLFAEAIASFIAFSLARRLTLPHAVEPTQVREASLGERPRIVPGGLPAVAGPFVIIAATAAYVWTHAAELPARIPVHFDSHLQADGWVNRTPATLFAPLLVGIIVLATIAISLHGLGHWVRAVYSGGALGAREVRFRRVVAALLVITSYVVATELTFVTLGPFYEKFHLTGGIRLAIGFAPLVFVIVAVVALIKLGPGGSGVPAAVDGTPVGDRTPDRYWRLGVFYINPDDPAILVEKRFGLGYTFNFGHAVSWLIVFVPIALAAIAPIVLHHAS
jgi:uncharacterized membrane protein